MSHRSACIFSEEGHPRPWGPLPEAAPGVTPGAFPGSGYGLSPVSGWADEVLAKSVRCDGDPEAFAELYRRYADKVRGWAVNRRRHNADEADDLAAEVFTQALAWLRAPEGDPVAYRVGSPFSNWLFAVVGADVDRRSRRAWWRHSEAVRVVLEDAVLRDGRGADSAGELTGELGAAVAALPETERRAIELRYVDGYTVETAAAVAGITESQVRWASKRALRKLGRPERHRARRPAPPRGMGSGGPRVLAALAGALGEQPVVDVDIACAALGIARRTANRMLTALAAQQLAVPLGPGHQRGFRLDTSALTRSDRVEIPGRPAFAVSAGGDA